MTKPFGRSVSTSLRDVKLESIIGISRLAAGVLHCYYASYKNV